MNNTHGNSVTSRRPRRAGSSLRITPRNILQKHFPVGNAAYSRSGVSCRHMHQSRSNTVVAYSRAPLFRPCRRSTFGKISQPGLAVLDEVEISASWLGFDYEPSIATKIDAYPQRVSNQKNLHRSIYYISIYSSALFQPTRQPATVVNTSNPAAS